MTGQNNAQSNNDDDAAEQGSASNALSTPPHINITPDTNLNHIKVVDCTEDNFEGPQRTNKYVLGFLLSIRHTSQTESRLMTTSMASRYSSAAGARARLNNSVGSRGYDRIMTYADPKDNGRCYVQIAKNAAKSQEIFKHCIASQEGVGNLFLMEEPQKVKNTLGSSKTVFIIDDCLECYPISGEIKDHVPAVPLSTPPAGETRWFAMHGDDKVSLTNATFQKASCTGKFCDRQAEVPHGQKCGCFFLSRTNAFVVEMELMLPVDATFEARGKVTISNFRSLRTSGLFVDESSWKQLDANNFYQHRKKLRQAIEQVTAYVAENGGWSYIGWVRTGTVQDSSDIDRNGPENLSSISQQPHISYLYPTNTDIVTSAEFKQKQFRTTLA